MSMDNAFNASVAIRNSTLSISQDIFLRFPRQKLNYFLSEYYSIFNLESGLIETLHNDMLVNGFSKPLIMLHVLTHKQNYDFSCKKMLVPKQETSYKFIKNILTLKSQDLVFRFILLNCRTSRHFYKQI